MDQNNNNNFCTDADSSFSFSYVTLTSIPISSIPLYRGLGRIKHIRGNDGSGCQGEMKLGCKGANVKSNLIGRGAIDL